MEEIVASTELGSGGEVKKPKKKGKKKFNPFLIYLFIMIIATAVSLGITLSRNFDGILHAFASCDYRWLLAANGVILLSFLIDGVVIMLFMRLYTTKYKYHQALAVSTIGSFYCNVTPGENGGQVTQAVTLRNQGSQISNAASIIVMYYILHKAALTIYELITVILKWNLLYSIGNVPVTFGTFKFSIPLAPLTIIGFFVNLITVGAIVLMSYSHRMHNFVMHYGVGIAAKFHIVKNADKTREGLRIQVENFKIELRRLLSNFRVTAAVFILFFLMLTCKFSIPWFMGAALNGYGTNITTGLATTGNMSFNAFMNACFMSNYHTMIMGLIPIPGSAGVSEVFFNKLFENYYISPAVVSASQILWRSVSFYFPLIITGIITAVYKSAPKEEPQTINRKTFVTMQLMTYEERKKSSDTIYETTQMNRKEFQNRLKEVLIPKSNKKDKVEEEKDYKIEETDLHENTPFIYIEDSYVNKNKKKKRKHLRRKDDDENWRDFNIK